jgi:hypothetical protein
VFVKQSSIPDRVTKVTEKLVVAGSLLDQHYAIKEKVKQIGHVFVNAFVALISTFIAALLQAMVCCTSDYINLQHLHFRLLFIMLLV